MAQLLRIILIHTHLPGVVELQLDQHTNICGTNASGKTTLQRLVPVFYGEQPNRVVPKTRKKFDQFYLPFSNSYIIYEYQRDNADICQVVLTRKSDGGVEYRFVAAAYLSEHYLQQTADGVKGYSYAEWASAMRGISDLQISHKIAATSEYRSIIQNDAAALRGNSNDNVKLRRLAASFSLVSSGHKLRHIEKLVSAVHAKEGKMETLKAMLAAIFEEDGVILPTTKMKNTKAREWILQMRQSMRIDTLQQSFQHLTQLARQLDSAEASLAALLPLLQQDEQQQLQQKSDAEQQINTLRGQINSHKQLFSEQQMTLNSSLSKAEADLTETTARLDQLQLQYEAYESRDMSQLQQDTDALPLWRDSLQDLLEQYQLMVEQHGDLERQLEQRKAKLAEAFNRLSEQQRLKAKQLQQQKDHTRQQQDDALSSLEQGFQQRLQQQQNQFAEQLSQCHSAIAVLQSQLTASVLTDAEHEERQIAGLRLEQAQQQAQQQARQVQQIQQQWQKARQQREQADSQLQQSRQQLHHAEQHLQQLHRQLSPEQGSLRHFLRLHYPGWEQTLGKVLEPDLLERLDLQPKLAAKLEAKPGAKLDQKVGSVADSLFGLQLELTAIDSPEHAQDEAAIRHSIQTAEQLLVQATQHKQQAEKQLQQQHEQAELVRAQQEQAQWQYSQLEQNIEYASDASKRLEATHRELVKQRQATVRAELSQQQQQLEQLKQQQQQDLQALTDDHQAQKIELKADWQAELQVFDQQLEQLDQQLADKRDDNKQQIKELQQAFNEELSSKGIDPRRLIDLKQRQEQLKTKIKNVESRQDELAQWLRFMQLDWQQLRPQLLEKETALKQQQRQLQQQLTQLKTEFTASQKLLEQQRQQWQDQMQQAEQALQQLKITLAKFADLHLTAVTPAVISPTMDLIERLARSNEALAERSKVEQQLSTQLEQFETSLSKDAGSEFLDRLEHEKRKLPEFAGKRQQLPILADLLRILQDQQQQLLEMGENIGGDLKKFFTVFSDINKRIAMQSRRLSAAVADDLVLEGISKSEVRILSTIDELGFWQPLKHFAKLYDDWGNSGKALPSEDYLNALADVVELLRADEQYSIESLLRLELHLTEGGSELIIKSDRQLLESSSHGMAYLILCKYLLAFTRLLRGDANVAIHWPIDEIGTLAYHNVEMLFMACSSNNIIIVGAFPNPESDVLMLFQHRYLIEPSQHDPSQRQLKRIQPKVSRLSERLAQRQQEVSL
ncbi:ATP-binding protein [Rheinheimera salexigens]|uniref:ATP-binding protein n=1 Tax=Rheinheimera salexigens TaxID=1628148 RepID=A0A1E7Q2Y1_9GAMM|nr:ATP-binding protein [Rheinheimera salexigens]OEY68564.1 ATP-binding protein [Rheinheimera salexigens]